MEWETARQPAEMEKVVAAVGWRVAAVEGDTGEG